jgi:hypothetical protein
MVSADSTPPEEFDGGTEEDGTYLGDGLTVHNEGWQLRVETDRYGVTHWLAFGPGELAALVRFARAHGYEIGDGR